MIDSFPVRVLLGRLVLLLGSACGCLHGAHAQVEPGSAHRVASEAPRALSADFPKVPDSLASLDRSSIDLPPTRAAGPARSPLWVTPSGARSIHGLSVGPVLSWPGANRWKKVNGVGVSFIGFGAAPVLFYGPGALIMPLDQIGFLSDRDQDGILTVSGSADFDTLRVGEMSSFGGPARGGEFGTVVNGLLLSPGGAPARHVRGVSLSAYLGGAGRTDGVVVNGIWSISGEHRGLLVGTVANVGRGYGLVAGGSALSIEMTGVQVAVLNQSGRMRGVQVGLYNFSGDLQGFQIGLVNRTPERTLPLLNWSFD